MNRLIYFVAAASVVQCASPQVEELTTDGDVASVDLVLETVVADAPLSGFAELALVEPRPAVHPDDPHHMVVGAIAASPIARDSGWTCVALTTFDSGTTWLGHDLEVDRCIDPWVVYTGAESVLYTAIQIARESENEDRFRLVAYRSSDRGRSWSGPEELGHGFEHPMVAADQDGLLLLGRRMSPGSADAARQRVFLARSTDAGATFDLLSELRPPATGSELSEITPTGLVRLDDGRVVVSASTGGTAWSLRSSDGGRTFPDVAQITDSCAGGGTEDGFAGWPFFTGEAATGRVYHACIRRGFDGLEIRSSSDGGATWSGPSVLGSYDGDTNAAEVVSGDARTAMLTVSRFGVVGVAWYDRSLDPEHVCQRVMFTASADGGGTWATPIAVTEEPSCPQSGDNGWTADSWPMGGDYSSLVTDQEGLFHLVWADSRGGRFALRRTAVRVNPRPAR